MIEILSLTKDYVIIYKPVGIPSQPDPSGDKDAMTATGELLWIWERITASFSFTDLTEL